jgi:hypothetical protein
MNRNSPVPLWALLSIGVVLLGSIYVLAQQSVAQPERSVIVRQPSELARPNVSAAANPSLAIASPTTSATLSPPFLHPAVSPTSVPLGSTSSSRLGDLRLLYPRGGEVFKINEILSIKYFVGPALKKKLKSIDSLELYLLDSNDFLVGFIGEVQSASSEFDWNPQELMHSAGMDELASPPPPGTYRLLLSARHPFVPDTTVGGGEGGDTPLDGDYQQFRGGYVMNTYTPDSAPEQLIASDVTDSPIELVK